MLLSGSSISKTAKANTLTVIKPMPVIFSAFLADSVFAILVSTKGIIARTGPMKTTISKAIFKSLIDVVISLSYLVGTNRISHFAQYNHTIIQSNPNSIIASSFFIAKENLLFLVVSDSEKEANVDLPETRIIRPVCGAFSTF